MRSLARCAAFACSALIFAALSACHPQQPQPQSTASISPPSNPNDANAWENYVVKVSHADLQKVTAAKPYLFIVPSGPDPSVPERRKEIQDALSQMAARNMFPGPAIAVGGPDSHATAEVLNQAFGLAKPESLKGLTVLFIGADADKSMAKKAIETAGATFRFVAM